MKGRKVAGEKVLSGWKGNRHLGIADFGLLIAVILPIAIGTAHHDI